MANKQIFEMGLEDKAGMLKTWKLHCGYLLVSSMAYGVERVDAWTRVLLYVRVFDCIGIAHEVISSDRGSG